MRVKSLLLIAAVSAIPFFAVAASSSTSTLQTTSSTLHPISDVAKESDISFVQTSQQVKLTRKVNGNYEMVMSGVKKQVLWFTDRPAHKAGMWAMPHFIQEWKQGQTNFFVDHPNAALSANTKTDGSGQNVLKVLELSNPNYNAENDTLTYDAHVILDVNHNMDNEHLYHGTLFIGSQMAG